MNKGWPGTREGERGKGKGRGRKIISITINFSLVVLKYYNFFFFSWENFFFVMKLNAVNVMDNMRCLEPGCYVALFI